MSVTFCGHGRINRPEELSSWLDMILPSLIEGGADTFYLGGYGDFDGMAASAVQRQKEIYPHIESVLVLAYLNTEGEPMVTTPPCTRPWRKFRAGIPS